MSPGSRCPSCGAPVASSDNVPVLSGSSSRAAAGSAARRSRSVYPLMELANGLLWVLVSGRAPSWCDSPRGAALLGVPWRAGHRRGLRSCRTRSRCRGSRRLALSFCSVSRTRFRPFWERPSGGGLFLVAFLYEKIADRRDGPRRRKMLGMIGASARTLGRPGDDPRGVALRAVVGLALIALNGDDGKTRCRRRFPRARRDRGWFFAIRWRAVSGDVAVTTARAVAPHLPAGFAALLWIALLLIRS